MCDKFFEEVNRISQENDEFVIEFDDKYFGIRFYSGDIACAGWDYYYLDKHFNSIEDGVLDFPDDDSDFPLVDAVKVLFDDLGIILTTYRFVEPDWFFEKAMA